MDEETPPQIVATAAHLAADVISDAAEKAALLAAERSDEKITKILGQALEDVFGEHQASKRFIDVTRIPLLCKSIIDTNTRLENIETKLDAKYVTNEAFSPVKNLVYGLVTLILTAVIGAILVLVIK